jgi:hypothetical protein
MLIYVYSDHFAGAGKMVMAVMNFWQRRFLLRLGIGMVRR